MRDCLAGKRNGCKSTGVAPLVSPLQCLAANRHWPQVTSSGLVTKSIPGRETTATEADSSWPRTLPSLGANDSQDDEGESGHAPEQAPRRFPWTRSSRPEKKAAIKEHGPTGISLLHRAREPAIDIVFVHGLRGGSVKTWQKGGDARRFWPKLWLPKERGFEQANIHAFGYDADWSSEKGDILKIHDFGQQLFEDMRISPGLTDDPMVNHNEAPLHKNKTTDKLIETDNYGRPLNGWPRYKKGWHCKRSYKIIG